MKNALVIAAREFEEKRFVAYAAVAIAFVPFIFAAIPGLKANPADTIAMGSLVFGSAFAIAVGVISGASFIGRDLSDGRMSFYFSRPVSALSIWFGKLTAAILMIVGTFGFIILPARLAAGDRWTRLVSTTMTWSVLYILVIALALFLIAHVISTFARSRSPLIVFDFAAAVICGVAIRLLVLPLDAGGAVVILKWLTISLAIAAVVAIVGGGAWQLERGRTDRRRNHLALSQFLWGTMAVALLIAAAYVAWVVSVKPSDLTSPVRATRSTSGPFAVISGTSRGRADYHAVFLLNTEDGSTTVLDPRAEWGVRYTRDGRSAVVPRASGNSAEMVMYTRGKSEPINTGLTIDAGDYFVSDDGGRIATISHPNILSVYDVAQKRSLASVRLPDAKYVRAFFVTPDVLRLYLNVADGLKIVELDVRARGLQETGVIASSNFVSFYTDPTAARMLAKRSREDVLMLSDARTGASIRTIVSGTQVKTARFLRDGRMVFVDGPGTAAVLHILTADGIPQGDVPLGPNGWVTFVGDDGMRVVLLAGTSATHGELIAVNLDRRVVERREAIINWLPSGTVDLRPPIVPLHEVWYSDFSNWKNRILAWNPATGGKRIITGG